jgi:hypothetical protein
MNLIEGPWALPTFQQPESNIIKRDNWTIIGSAEYGLPNPSATEVYWALVSMARMNGFTEPMIRYSAYQLLTKVLLWATGGKSYQRLRRSLEQLTGVTIQAQNWYDLQTGQYHKIVGFHILDDFSLMKGSPGPGEPQDTVTINRYVWKSLQTGYVATIDYELIRGLKRPTTRLLYSFLNRHLTLQPVYSIRLAYLAQQKLGLTLPATSRRNSQALKKLKPAFSELQKAGYIYRVEIERDREEWLCVFKLVEHASEKRTPWKQPKPVSKPDQTHSDLLTWYNRWVRKEVEERLQTMTKAQEESYEEAVRMEWRRCGFKAQIPARRELQLQAIRTRCAALVLGIPDFESWKQQH